MRNPRSQVLRNLGRIIIVVSLAATGAVLIPLPRHAQAAAVTTASRVYGQPDFTSNLANNPAQKVNPNDSFINARSLSNPVAVALDGAGGLYVADQQNNRVLHYPAGNTTADRVYGQPDFNTNIANTGGLSATSLSGPQGVAVDSVGGLYVADVQNNRVLHYSPTTLTSNIAADRVYGQPNFATNTANPPAAPTATSLRLPRGVAADRTGGLYVADWGNSRVLHYPPNPVAIKGKGVAADQVFGQPDFISSGGNQNQSQPSQFTLYQPKSVAVDHAGGLYVADNQNSRVLHYLANAPFSSGKGVAADQVYGQPGFITGSPNPTPTPNPTPSPTPDPSHCTGPCPYPSTLAYPIGVAADVDGGLYVADSYNNRVLHYVAVGAVATASRVYGQPDFTTNSANTGGVSAISLDGPIGVAVDSTGGVYVADYFNNRVLFYPPTITTATRVYGQPNFTTNIKTTGGVSATSLYGPAGVAVDSAGGLYIAELGNTRVLHFPAGSTTADQVYGQPNFTTVKYTGAGQPSASSFRGALAIAIEDTNGITTGFYVADWFNSRVLHFVVGATAADRVYGQPDFTTSTGNTGGISATSLNIPLGVAVESSNGSASGLYIADGLNNRVLHYPGTSTIADCVYGQPNFTKGTRNSGSPNPNATSLYSPAGMAFDSTHGLHVVDGGNNRVVHHGTTCVTNAATDQLFGQPDVFSNSKNAGGLSAMSLNGPTGVAVDSAGGVYAADFANNRVLFFPAPAPMRPIMHPAGSPQLPWWVWPAAGVLLAALVGVAAFVIFTGRRARMASGSRGRT